MGVTQFTGTTQPMTNKYIGDAHIFFKAGKLDAVTPSLAKKAQKDAVIVWKIRPPKHAGKYNKVKLCLKPESTEPGDTIPFTDAEFQNDPHCKDSVKDEVTGKVIDASKLPESGFLLFFYSVRDAYGNEIDPPGVIYK